MTNGSSSDSDTPAVAGCRAGVVDLLGLLAYAELVGFFRLSDDAERAPTLAGKGELAGLAATEYAHYKRLRDHLAGLGIDPEAAMEPFVAPLDAWHARTEPQSWLESLVKAYVGDGIAGDFYRQVAQLADDETGELVAGVVSESGRAEFVAAQVRAAVEQDPTIAGRLSLWARRLVGEALSQAQVVAASRVELAALLAVTTDADGGAEDGKSIGGNGGTGAGPADLATVSRIFAKLTDAHAARLEAMGLSG
ncbi:MAG: ferritin-like fold-containing protein [Nocardiopsaceae bacterium]|nr:ferritin-like fold-containing protein [Nocardiopsaceae bacterium]